jgi:cobalt-zinc-cadmium efflux system protein
MSGHTHHDHKHHGEHGEHAERARAAGVAAAHGAVHRDFGTAFLLGIALNLGFVIIEALYGLIAHSVALVADAGHNLGDVLGLAMAWIAAILARRQPSATHTYGLRRGTILAALLNAMLLLIAVGAIAVEGVRRLIEPEAVASRTVMAVAAIGILVNGATAWLFAAGRKGDINLRAAFLHMSYDALISLGVVVSAGVIMLTGWTRLDALVSLAIAAIILAGTWTLLRDSLGMSLDAVPPGLKKAEVGSFLCAWPGVSAIHDLHIWSMSTTETALTCHLLMPGGHPGDQVLAQLAQELLDRYRIGHVTVQIETDVHTACALEPDHIV